MRAVKLQSLFHVGINRNGGEIILRPIYITLDFHVLEAENSKPCLVVIYAIRRNIMYLLKGCCNLFICALDVFESQLSVLIHKLSESEM